MNAAPGLNGTASSRRLACSLRRCQPDQVRRVCGRTTLSARWRSPEAYAIGPILQPFAPGASCRFPRRPPSGSRAGPRAVPAPAPERLPRRPPSGSRAGPRAAPAPGPRAVPAPAPERLPPGYLRGRSKRGNPPVRRRAEASIRSIRSPGKIELREQPLIADPAAAIWPFPSPTEIESPVGTPSPRPACPLRGSETRCSREANRTPCWTGVPRSNPARRRRFRPERSPGANGSTRRSVDRERIAPWTGPFGPCVRVRRTAGSRCPRDVGLARAPMHDGLATHAGQTPRRAYPRAG